MVYHCSCCIQATSDCTHDCIHWFDAFHLMVLFIHSCQYCSGLDGYVSNRFRMIAGVWKHGENACTALVCRLLHPDKYILALQAGNIMRTWTRTSPRPRLWKKHFIFFKIFNGLSWCFTSAEMSWVDKKHHKVREAGAASMTKLTKVWSTMLTD